MTKIEKLYEDLEVFRALLNFGSSQVEIEKADDIEMRILNLTWEEILEANVKNPEYVDQFLEKVRIALDRFSRAKSDLIEVLEGID